MTLATTAQSAAEIVTDGATFNGVTINGLGFNKAFMIYSRAMIVYMNPYSDFAQHADSLAQSCQDLINVTIPDIMTGLPSVTISAADCAEVANVIQATALKSYPAQCNFSNFFIPFDEDSYCNVASINGDQQMIYDQEFLVDPEDWKVYADPVNGSEWNSRNFTWVETMPFHNSSGFFGPDPFDVNCETSNQAGLIHLESPAIKIPTAGTVFIEFSHFMDTEITWDGGIVEISINGAHNFTYLSNSDAVVNGYPSSPLLPSPNPLAGMITYSGGYSRPYLIPTWGRTIFSYKVAANDEIRFRFTFGTDYCGGTGSGWYIDTFKVYTCSAKSSDTSDKGLTTAQIAGISVGVIAFVAIVVIVSIIVVKKRANASERKPLLPN